MRKLFVPLFVVLALCLSLGTAFGASAKNSVDAKGTQLLGTKLNEWTQILQANVHTSDQKDLVVDVSLECGLETFTRVKSKGFQKDTSAAMASIEVAVVLDGNFTANNEDPDGYKYWEAGSGSVAYPGDVTYAKREQTLSGTFSGFSCTDTNDDNILTFDECTLTDEEVSLMLDTMSANAFNFILTDPGVGDHTITVMARIKKVGENCPADHPDLTYDGDLLMCSDGNDPADLVPPNNEDVHGRAWIGKGSLAIDEVRFVKGMIYDEGTIKK